MAIKNYLVAQRSFIGGALREVGSIVQLDEKLVNEGQPNLVPVEGDVPSLPRVQISPVAPTGPNPTMPQQIPPDARQTLSGYEQPGAQLVGEVTRPEADRIEAAQLLDEGDDTQSQLTEQIDTAVQEAQQAERDALLQLDHDGDGKPGGSKSGTESTRARGAAKAAK